MPPSAGWGAATVVGQTGRRPNPGRPVEARRPKRGRRALPAQPTQTGTAAVSTNITPVHCRDFQASTSGEYGNFAHF